MIRRATPGDLNQIHTLIKLWDEIKHTPKSAILEGIQDVENQTILCTTMENGEIVGFLQAAIQEKTWEINRVFTHPAQRKKGHGTALFNALANTLDEKQQTALLITGRKNKALQRLARRHGFTREGAPKMGCSNMKMIRYPGEQRLPSPSAPDTVP